jgi:hypothetical protein
LIVGSNALVEDEGVDVLFEENFWKRKEASMISPMHAKTDDDHLADVPAVCPSTINIVIIYIKLSVIDASRSMMICDAEV